MKNKILKIILAAVVLIVLIVLVWETASFFIETVPYSKIEQVCIQSGKVGSEKFTLKQNSDYTNYVFAISTDPDNPKQETFVFERKKFLGVISTDRYHPIGYSGEENEDNAVGALNFIAKKDGKDINLQVYFSSNQKKTTRMEYSINNGEKKTKDIPPNNEFLVFIDEMDLNQSYTLDVEFFDEKDEIVYSEKTSISAASTY